MLLYTSSRSRRLLEFRFVVHGVVNHKMRRVFCKLQLQCSFAFTFNSYNHAMSEFFNAAHFDACDRISDRNSSVIILLMPVYLLSVLTSQTWEYVMTACAATYCYKSSYCLTHCILLAKSSYETWTIEHACITFMSYTLS